MTSSSSNPSPNSGDGARPTTDGGVDNIGAGSKLTKDNGPEGPNDGPAPTERMINKRSDAASSAADDSAPLDLKENDRPASNKQPPDPRLGDAGH